MVAARAYREFWISVIHNLPETADALTGALLQVEALTCLRALATGSELTDPDNPDR